MQILNDSDKLKKIIANQDKQIRQLDKIIRGMKIELVKLKNDVSVISNNIRK